AHVGGTTGYASITVSRGTVRYALTLPAAALTPDLAEALRLVQAGSQQNREKLLDLLRRHIALTAHGTRRSPRPRSLAPAPVGPPSVTMYVDFACGGAVRELAVRDDVFDVLGPDHHTLAKLEAGDQTRQLAFAPDAREARVSLGGGEAARPEGSF